jgi:DNA-binding protein HU-beta
MNETKHYWRKSSRKNFLDKGSNQCLQIRYEHFNGLSRKDIKSVIESLVRIGYKELKKTGAFFVPGFAKFVVIKKPATKARKGINPFTKEPTIFKAKPARKVIRARPVKTVKDAVA